MKTKRMEHDEPTEVYIGLRVFFGTPTDSSTVKDSKHRSVGHSELVHASLL